MGGNDGLRHLSLHIEIKHYNKGFLSWRNSMVFLSDKLFVPGIVKSKFFKVKLMKNVFNDMTYQFTKGKKSMTLVINLEMRDLDALINRLIDNQIRFGADEKKSELLKAILKTINESSKSDAKIELIQTLLEWVNRTNIVNDILATFIQNTDNKGGILEELGLEIGEIKLEK